MSNKNESNLTFTWIDKPEQVGEMIFTFDGKKIFNLFRDYPHELTPEEKEIFDNANPFWANFFKARKGNP